MSATFTDASPMKRFSQILALLILALMVPASMCCYGADGCAVEACCSEGGHDHEDHDGDENHAPVSCPSDTISHSQVPTQVTMPEMQLVELIGIIQAFALLDLVEQAACPVPMPTTAPLELRTSWAFVRRAALRARAPAVLA